MKRFIFFDIDGTLVLTDGAGKRALASAMEKSFDIESANTDIDYGGRTDLSICKEIFNLNGVDFHPSEFNRFMDCYTSCLRTELQISAGTVLPGVKALLEHLQAEPQYALGLLTGNIRSGAYKKLEAHNLDSYFSFGGFGDRQELRPDIAKEGKQDAEKFAQKNLRPEEILVIGDTPHDVTCSRAIGASVIAVCTGYSQRSAIEAEKPDLILDDLSDLDAVLGHMDRLF